MSGNPNLRTMEKIRHYQIISNKTGEIVEDLHCTWSQVKARAVGVSGVYPKRINDRPKRRKPSKPAPDKELHYQAKVVRRRKAFLALPEKLQLEEVAWEIVKIGPSAARQLFEDYFE